MGQVIEITGKEFRRMQLIQLDMLKEFDRVCRKHDIKYVIFAGTLLGAVRHKGYIPWDDDADIAMLREDYENFKKVASEMNPDICYFQDHTTDPGYLWGYGKLRRTGTTFVRAGQEHMKGQTGICLDVFPLDDAPKTLPMQMLQDFHCFCLRKTIWAQVAKENEKGFWKFWYTLLSKIPVDTVYANANKWYISKSSNDRPNRVRILFMPSTGKFYRKAPLPVRYSMPKKWFLERAEYQFEDTVLYGIQDYDAFLEYEYGDYMTLPPEEKRVAHAPCSSYDFGGIREDVLYEDEQGKK
ncbi:MAG: LicD family protein [Solobacterium sp.]|nr:LicD family protein [Solobacterium sp.]